MPLTESFILQSASRPLTAPSTQIKNPTAYFKRRIWKQINGKWNMFLKSYDKAGNIRHNSLGDVLCHFLFRLFAFLCCISNIILWWIKKKELKNNYNSDFFNLFLFYFFNFHFFVNFFFPFIVNFFFLINIYVVIFIF